MAHWYLSLFTQTFFYHRYGAHQMFTMSKFWEKVFYFLSFVFQGSSYLSVYAYSVMHRMHHAYPDKEKDPHSPKFSKNIFAMMWKTKIIYSQIATHQLKHDDSFYKNVPHWHLFDNVLTRWHFRIFWIIAYSAFYFYFATSWWLWFLLPIQLIMGPFHGAIINWFAHKYGYTNFDVDDTSKNLLPFDFLMLGESYHNNHHKLGERPNFGIKWHEFDPIYPIILILNSLHIIRLKKTTKEE